MQLAIHEIRDDGLRRFQDLSGLILRETTALDDLRNPAHQLGLAEQFFSIWEPEVSEDVARPLFDLCACGHRHVSW